MDKFGGSFLNREGSCDSSALKDVKIVGLLFGAEYCEPFNRFLPNLIEFYNKVNADEKVFEILYFPFDQKQSQFLDYFQDCPWLSYDFKDSNKIKMYLEYKQHIIGIPSLIILHTEDASIITKDGRGHVEKQGTDAFEHWQNVQAMK